MYNKIIYLKLFYIQYVIDTHWTTTKLYCEVACSETRNGAMVWSSLQARIPN